MAQSREPQNVQHNRREQSLPSTLPLFENYLKMARFNTSETELLERCSVPVTDTDLLTAPPSSKLQEDNSTSVEDLMEIDHEYLLQTLMGESDFSETITDFSSISITEQSKRKKKRSERWRRSNNEAVGYHVGHTNGDINARRVSPHGLINHKTIVMQHESCQTSPSLDHKKSQSKSDVESEPIVTNENTRERSMHVHRSKDSSVHSRQSKDSSRHRRRSKDSSTQSGKSKNCSMHSHRSKEGSTHSHRNIEDPGSSRSDGKDSSSAPPPTGHETGSDITPSITSHTECQEKQSWSRRIERHSTDSSIEESQKESTSKSKRTKHQRQSPKELEKKKHQHKSRRRRGSEQSNCEESESLLGRNMRAAPRREVRKLRA